MAKLDFSITDKAAFEKYLAENLEEQKAFAEGDKRTLAQLDDPGNKNDNFVEIRLKIAFISRLEKAMKRIDDLSFRLAFISALNPASPNLAAADFKIDDKATVEKSLTERFEAAKARFAESDNVMIEQPNAMILLALHGRREASLAEAEDAAFKYHQLKALRP